MVFLECSDDWILTAKDGSRGVYAPVDPIRGVGNGQKVRSQILDKDAKAKPCQETSLSVSASLGGLSGGGLVCAGDALPPRLVTAHTRA